MFYLETGFLDGSRFLSYGTTKITDYITYFMNCAFFGTFLSFLELTEGLPEGNWLSVRQAQTMSSKV